ncbi:MAG: hypothetical protein PVG60_09145 [Desulfarculaceae bacterium]|jgi:hypothetical protein
MRRKIIVAGVALLGLVFSALTGFADQGSTNRQESALKGIVGVEIIVSVSEATEGFTLNLQSITDYLNGILKDKGVPVIKPGEKPDQKVGVLRFHLALAPHIIKASQGQGMAVFIASLDTTCGLRVNAPNRREPTFAVVWSTGGVAIFGDPRSPVIGQGLISQALEFAEDYRAANQGGEKVETKDGEVLI